MGRLLLILMLFNIDITFIIHAMNNMPRHTILKFIISMSTYLLY